MNRVEISSGKLFIGPAPFRTDLEDNKPFDVIWNLAEGFEYLLEEEQEFASKVLLARIKDYDVPADPEAFRAQLFEVVQVLQDNGKVLLHCAAGHGRTGMALACVKHFVDMMPVDECLSWSLETCHGPENEKQIKFVKMICEKQNE